MQKIVIDTDGGVDDAFAILLANTSKKINLQAITTVEGNCKLNYVNQNVFKMLEFTNNNDILVYEGEKKPLIVKPVEAEHIHGENGLGSVEFDPVKRKVENIKAVDYLVKEVNSNPKKIKIVAIGPLTNIALAIKKDKNFVKNVKELIIMGGGVKKGNITKFAEFNFYRDPHAAEIVFKAGFKNLIMIGLDVTEKLPLTAKLENLLIDINTDLSNLLYKASRLGAEFDRKSGHDGFILNDALTIAYLIDKSILNLKKAHIDIKIDGEEIGRSIIIDNKKTNCKIAYNVNVNKFYRILFTNIFNKNNKFINKYLVK